LVAAVKRILGDVNPSQPEHPFILASIEERKLLRRLANRNFGPCPDFPGPENASRAVSETAPAFLSGRAFRRKT
jgi:hypothetical protein